MTRFTNYQQARENLMALKDDFAATGKAFRGLYYDEYRPLPWTVTQMTRYRRDLEVEFARCHPGTWSEWCNFEGADEFGRFHGDQDAYEPFVRSATTAFRVLADCARLAASGAAPLDAVIELPEIDNFGGWLHLIVKTAEAMPTAFLAFENVTTSYPRNFLHLESAPRHTAPEYLHYDVNGRITPAPPIRVTLVNDLFRCSAEAIRLWLYTLSPNKERPVFLPDVSPVSPEACPDPAGTSELLAEIRDRVRVNDEQRTICIDGTTYDCENDEQREFLSLLARANGEIRSFADLRKQSQLLNLVTHQTRLLDHLPLDLRSLVESVSGKGYRFVLPQVRSS